MRYDILCLLTHAEAALWRWIEKYDRTHPEATQACTGNFICSCERRNCPGRTMSIEAYTKGIKRA